MNGLCFVGGAYALRTRGATCGCALSDFTRRRMASVTKRGRRASTLAMTSVETNETAVEPFTAAGMTIEDFFQRSLGEWRSMRSSHNLAWQHIEEVHSEISIEHVPLDCSEVLQICEDNEETVESTVLAVRMSWEGSSDWDENETLKGSTILVVIKDAENGGRSGRLLRSEGYAETIPAVGQWVMTEEGVFVLHTPYDRASAEERIWFVTNNLRMRVSLIKTQAGTGVLTASLSSEIRNLKS